MTNLSNLYVILACFTLGIGLRYLRVMPANAHVTLNRFIIYISFPALTLKLVHDLHLSKNALFPVLMPWIFFLAAVVFFRALSSAFNWSAHTLGALILTAGLGNTSFLGYPLIEAFYGKEGLPIGVLIDQPGSFMVLSTLGVLTASLCSGSGFDPKDVARRILIFPPFMATMLSLCTRGLPYPPQLMLVLDRLGSTLVPIALVSVGMQLSLDRSSLKSERARLFAGLGYKLFLGPALISLLYFKIFHATGKEIEISVFQAAMAPMITGGIIAAENNLNPRLASLMIGIGIPLSLITVPLWWWAASHCLQ